MPSVRRPPLAWVVFGAMVVVCFLSAYWTMFGFFASYDDEGTLLADLWSFVDGHALYRDIYSQYGPFYYELFCPIAIFQGRLRGAEMYGALAIQCGWLLAMWAAARLMWKRGLGHYQAVGG